MKSFLTFSACLLAGLLPAAEFAFDFSEGKWNRDDFWDARSPRWDMCGSWIQMPDGLVNDTPVKPDAKGNIRYHAESYIALMWKKPVEAPMEFSSTMAFDVRMAPLLVLAPDLADAKNGMKEFREHWEIVLFDQGLNIWHHEYKDGKPSWYLAACMQAPFAARERHTLTVRIVPRRGRMMMMAICDGREFGYYDPGLPSRFYIGFTGCEGPCRFYDLKVKTDIGKKR